MCNVSVFELLDVFRNSQILAHGHPLSRGSLPLDSPPLSSWLATYAKPRTARLTNPSLRPLHIEQDRSGLIHGSYSHRAVRPRRARVVPLVQRRRLKGAAACERADRINVGNARRSHDRFSPRAADSLDAMTDPTTFSEWVNRLILVVSLRIVFRWDAGLGCSHPRFLPISFVALVNSAYVRHLLCRSRRDVFSVSC